MINTSIDYSYFLFCLLIWLLMGYMGGYVLIYFCIKLKRFNYKAAYNVFMCSIKGHKAIITDSIAEIGCRYLGGFNDKFPIKKIELCDRCDKVLRHWSKFGEHIVND